MGDLSPHFSRSEFRCKCRNPLCEGKAGDINPRLLTVLEEIRMTLGQPLVIRSGWRCQAHNVTAGGAKDSAHMRGCAVDLAAVNSRTRFTILKVALASGIDRLGVGQTVVHLDVDPSLDSACCWVYGS
jgi:zinc D-Ala-D-Ala carboxypeptidase